MPELPPLRLSGVAAAAALVAILAIGVKPVTDPDFWWHLSTGRYIVEQHLIPSHDVFSLTARSHRWITHEWLTELLFYGGWLLGGMRLLMVGTALVIAAAYGLVYRAARERGVPALLGAPLILLAGLASAHTWGTRPQMLSLLFTALYGLALTRMVVRRQPAPPLWLAAVMVPWVNLHGGFIFGLALLGIVSAGYALERLIEAARASTAVVTLDDADPAAESSAVEPEAATRGANESERDPQAGSPLDLGRCVLVVVLTILATLLNPNGLAGALYPISYLGNNASTRYISEWVSPDFHQFQYLLFLALVLLLIGGALANPVRARLAEVLVVLPFTVLAFQSVRNISLFAVICTPIVGQQLWQVVPSSWKRTRPVRLHSTARTALNWLCVGGIAVGVGFTLSGSVTDKAQAKAVAKQYPVGALAYIAQHGLPARGFDSYNWGGYLIWNWYGMRSVYVDGRPDMYGDRFMDQYIRAYDGGPSWQTLLNQNKLCYVLSEPDSGIAKALAGVSGWRLAFHDARAALYLRRGSQLGCGA